jgi:hypothetical protein
MIALVCVAVVWSRSPACLRWTRPSSAHSASACALTELAAGALAPSHRAHLPHACACVAALALATRGRLLCACPCARAPSAPAPPQGGLSVGKLSVSLRTQLCSEPHQRLHLAPNTRVGAVRYGSSSCRWLAHVSVSGSLHSKVCKQGTGRESARHRVVKRGVSLIRHQTPRPMLDVHMAWRASRLDRNYCVAVD